MNYFVHQGQYDRPPEHIRLVITSDTHTMTNYLRVPNGDVFIHCGDFLLRSKIQRSYKILDFLEELPHKYKIIVAGNHDVLCDLDFYYATISRWQYKLQASRKPMDAEEFYIRLQYGINIYGYNFYGMPWVPREHRQAFTYSTKNRTSFQPIDMIPQNTDILITHTPPRGVLDLTRRQRSVGSRFLSKRLSQTQVKLHCFGHVHNSNGVIFQDERISINAAACNNQYILVNQPYVVDIPMNDI